jgi:collagen type VII alpha
MQKRTLLLLLVVLTAALGADRDEEWKRRLHRGPRGLEGPTGSDGGSGAIGPQGLAGDTGPSGGNTGAQGAAGARGAQGAIGSTGNVGGVGQKGATGARGVIGAVGATGLVGDTGDDYIFPGQRGATGVTGPTGRRGNTGAVGSVGVTGADNETPGGVGNDGDTGAQGAAGPQGATGPQGVTGPRGIPGALAGRGPQGPSGDAGTNGATGQSGFNGTAPLILTETFISAQWPNPPQGQLFTIPTNVTLINIEIWGGGGSTQNASSGLGVYSTFVCPGATAGVYASASYFTRGVRQLRAFVGFGGLYGRNGEATTVVDVPEDNGPENNLISIEADGGTGTVIHHSCSTLSESGIVPPLAPAGIANIYGSNLVANSDFYDLGSGSGTGYVAIMPAGDTVQQVLAGGGTGGTVFGALSQPGAPGVLTTSSTSGVATSAIRTPGAIAVGGAGCVATAGSLGTTPSFCFGSPGGDGLVRIWY